MVSKTLSLSVVFAVFMLFLGSSQGYKFYVGGRDGWVANPSESYSHWAERNRFQVNDTLFFKFNKGNNESVLQVTKENYNQCNTKNPIKSFTQGDHCEFKFERSGPHYFISGSSVNCNKGQKLIVVVLAVRPKKSPPTPAPSPAPAHASPSPAPAPSASGPVPASAAPEVGPTAEGPAPTGVKNFASVVGAPLMGVVLSVILGSFVGWA